jgi:hypothetical protein
VPVVRCDVIACATPVFRDIQTWVRRAAASPSGALLIPVHTLPLVTFGIGCGYAVQTKHLVVALRIKLLRLFFAHQATAVIKLFGCADPGFADLLLVAGLCKSWW